MMPCHHIFVGMVVVIALCMPMLAQPAAASKDEIRQKGLTALKAGEFEQAERWFAELVKESPSRENSDYLALAEAGRGMTLLDQGRARDALLLLQKAFKKSPQNPDIRSGLVRAHFEAGDSKSALQAASDAAKDIPEDVNLAEALAQLCLRYGQVKKARYFLENANGLEPENTDIKLLLAQTSLVAGEPLEALAVLNDIPFKAGKPGQVLLLKGRAKAAMRDLPAAEADLNAAAQADPQSAEPVAALAWVSQIRGQHEQALTTLEKARALDPQNPAFPYQMAQSYFSLRKYDDAGRACETALKIAPSYDQAYLLLGSTWLERGNVEQAQAAFEQAVRLLPESAPYHRELGAALLRRGRSSAAMKELQQAAALDPKAAETYFWRAQVSDALKDHAKAIADMETAIALKPGWTEVHSALAKQYSAAGNAQGAARETAKVKELTKTNQEANSFETHTREAQIQLDAGHPALALPHLEAAIQLRPEDSPTSFNLGVAQLESGKADLAFQTLSKLAAREPGELATRAYLVRASLRVKKPEVARANLADLRKLAPTDGLLHAQLVEWLFQDERAEMTREQIRFTLALSLPPAQEARIRYIQSLLGKS